jgi:hypothetical protein
MRLDDVLERGLASAAEDYDVPADAVDRLRQQLAPAETAVDDQVRHPSRRAWRLNGHQWMGVAAALLVVLIVVPFAVGGSGGSDQGGNGGSAAVLRQSLPSAGSEGGGADAGHKSAAVPLGASAQEFSAQSPNRAVTGGTARSSAASDAVPGVQTRVVKTGQLDLQVGKGQVTATLNRLADLAAAERGYISDSHTEEAGPTPSGELTMRVPVQRFEDAVHQARTLVGTKVLGLQTSGEDVTSKYVDLQARIRALQATRATFLTILSKATTIGETLSVQQQITDVQTQIEQLQGQLRVLGDSAAMSTLTVTVDQKTVAVPAQRPHQDNGFVKAVKLSVSRFVHGVEAIVGILGPVVLVLLLVVLGWLAAKFGYRATRRHLV